MWPQQPPLASLLHLHKSKSGVFSAPHLLHSVTCITEPSCECGNQGPFDTPGKPVFEGCQLVFQVSSKLNNSTIRGKYTLCLADIDCRLSLGQTSDDCLRSMTLLLPESVTDCAHAGGLKVLQAESVAFAARGCSSCLCTCRRSQSAAGSASTPLESLPLLQQQPTTQQHTDHQKLQEQAQLAKAQTESRLHSKGKKDGAADGASPAENLAAHADEAAGMTASAGTVVASVSGRQCLCPCHKDDSYFQHLRCLSNA